MDTKTDTAAVPVWSAEELYDSLMREIEPDLTTDQIENLETKYPNETPEDAKARLEHYALAFVIFDESLAEWDTDRKEEIRLIKAEMQHIAEEKATAEDADALDKIEKSIDDSPAK